MNRVPYISAGSVFARLTAAEDIQRCADRGLFECACGRTKRIYAMNVKHGKTKSCGCLSSEYRVLYAQGIRHHPLYHTWQGIRQRTGNPSCLSYRNYGGRGISLCDRWQDSRTFIEDILREIGPRPEGRTPGGKPAWTLDRIDNDGDYEPGNVRWATDSMQIRNRTGPGEKLANLDAQIARLQERVRELESAQCAKCPHRPQRLDF